MTSTKYYVRVKLADVQELIIHLEQNQIPYDQLSLDIGHTESASALFSVLMSSHDALNLKLSHPLSGCLNYRQALDKT